MWKNESEILPLMTAQSVQFYREQSTVHSSEEAAKAKRCALTLPLLITACCPGLSLSTFWQNICWLRIKSTSSVLNFFSKASSSMPCSRITNLWLGHWLACKFLYFWRMCYDRWTKESFCLCNVIQIKYGQCLSIWNDVCKAKELLTIIDELHQQKQLSSHKLEMQDMNMGAN